MKLKYIIGATLAVPLAAMLIVNFLPTGLSESAILWTNVGCALVIACNLVDLVALARKRYKTKA